MLGSFRVRVPEQQWDIFVACHVILTSRVLGYHLSFNDSNLYGQGPGIESLSDHRCFLSFCPPSTRTGAVFSFGLVPVQGRGGLVGLERKPATRVLARSIAGRHVLFASHTAPCFMLTTCSIRPVILEGFDTLQESNTYASSEEGVGAC